jgi:SAM-dependent methyltransferase
VKFKKVIKYLLIPRFIWSNTIGFCPVCHHKTIFLFIDKLELIRNHAVCIRCRSVSRNRAIALCVLNEFSSRGIKKLSELRDLPNVKILNTSSNSPIAKALGSASNIFNSEYFDECPSGQIKNGIMCQDLENLSFDDDSLDLVITEDVFEHVKDFKKGFAEVHRTLKIGGYHIFSVPLFFANKTRNLFQKEGDTHIPIVLPIEYHEDSVRGRIPAYHYLGHDLFDSLEKIGFETNIHFSYYNECRKYATYNCYTFISKKMQ